MASSHFIVHVGGIGEAPLYHFNIQGSLFVLSGSDIKAPSSYNVYAITQDNNVELSLVPLQNARKDENSSLYVLDAKLSIEYVAFVDLIDLLSTSPLARKKEEIVIIDLTSDDEAINNDRVEAQKGSIVEVIDYDSPKVKTNTGKHQISPSEFSIIKLALDPNMRSLKLSKIVASSTWERVNEIPCRYNGNVVFKLSVQANAKITSMEGMEQAIDGHVWTKPTTTNITVLATIRKSYYGGDFECLFIECGYLLSTGSPNKSTWTVLFSVTGFGFDLANWFRISGLRQLNCSGSGLSLVQIQDWLVPDSVLVLCNFVQVLDCGWFNQTRTWSLVLDWLAVLVLCSVTGPVQATGLVQQFRSLVWCTSSGSGPSAGTQGSATQDPHIAASDSSSDFDVMEGYLMQQHLESSSQEMHALGQQPGVSMFSHLKETLSRATRSEHATNEINEGGGEVDLPFTSQIDPVLSKSVHVNTLATTPIGLSKLTPSETLLPDGRSLAEVQEVERYILAAREKEIKSLCKAEQRRATLAKAPMKSSNPLQSPELTTLKSQPIGSHIASGSKDTPNAAILDGVFLNENWECNLQTEKLTDLYTSYTYHVGWLDVIQATSNSTRVDEQQRMICDVIHSIVQMERQNLGIIMPSMGPMRFLDTTKAKQPTISQMETPSVSPMDPSYIVLPGVSMQSEPAHGSFSFLDLVPPSLGDLPTRTMNMTRTRLNFSSAYNPQTDGQSEIANLTVLDLLKAYVTEVDQRSQWEKYLPLVEYAYNNTVHTSTGKAPFEVIEGRSKSPLLLKVHGKIFAADEYSRDLKESFQKIKEAISIAQQKQKAAANKHRRALAFKENDWVLLKFPKARLRQTTGKNPTGHQKYYAKLAKRYYGPFQILKPINEMAYQLKLPNHWIIHNAFHVSLLKPYKGEPPREAIIEDPPEVEGQEEVLQPESVLRHEDKVLRNGKIIRRYLIKFKNYPFEDAKWMQGTQLKDSLHLVNAYNDSLE
ncbi:hypothetical protein L7F22_031366 [Adiantum nelumboides]|nr:hypothetical protein [Adiantum nelumboides]